MNKEQKKTIDKIIAIFMYGIFSPFVLLALIAKGVDICMKYLFENLLNPLYNKVCKIVRKPIPNSTVYGFHNSYLTDKLPFNKQDDYELVPNKFDINTLKPFDRVLVRLTNNCVWMPKFFSHYDTGPNVKYYPFVTTDNIGYPQCIPYNGNEHLCRKTYDCDEFYKTWE